MPGIVLFDEGMWLKQATEGGHSSCIKNRDAGMAVAQCYGFIFRSKNDVFAERMDALRQLKSEIGF